MADQQCPCKQKLSEGEKGILNFGISNFADLVRDPNAAAVGAFRQLGGANATRLTSLIEQAENPNDALYSALPSLQAVENKLVSLQGVVDGFAAESERLSNPRNLISIISSLGLFGELSCALGIEGLDIGVGLNVVNQNGNLSINYAVAANVDLEKILNQFSEGSGTALATAVQDLRAGLDGAFAKLDEANSAINGLLAEAQAMQNQAADFIQKYTSINGLAALINEASTDPCFKFGSTVNGSMVSPDFINAVRGGTPTGFGTSAR